MAKASVRCGTLGIGVAWLVLAGFAAAAGDVQPAAVGVVVSAKATPQERLAAEELAAYLGRLYPKTRFAVRESLPDTGPVIIVGSTGGDSGLARYVSGAKPEAPEGFVVTTVEREGRTMGVIAGADPAGTIFGVYALLERLGCGFYLSCDAVRPIGQPFSFDAWKVSDRPLARHRIVFEWHNFLSGCSAWNLPEWQRWIDQAQKMRFNSIMVHAYGNNPMFTFTHHGVTKQCGYLPTTRKGRDWGTSHVNDVRRLAGGFVFREAEFGADAAKAPDSERAQAAQRLMQQVFAHAARRGMHVCFALDVDTATSQPQEIILTLPPAARFEIPVTGNRYLIGQARDRIWLVNPDVADGYAYYKAQADALMRLYPQIDRLVLWMRGSGTPWLDLKAEQLPAAWRRQYEGGGLRVAGGGGRGTDGGSVPATAAARGELPGRFALAKVMAAFGRAMRELGYERVELMTGSWGFDWLEPSDRFFPAGMAFLPLDYEVLHQRSAFENPESRALVRRIAARRPVVPVAWAHHDDGHYIGRSYTPFPRFQDKLDDAGCGDSSTAGGFGIIHWTTRPLDLYFKSLAQQVWAGEKNEPLAVTCREMGERLLGKPSAQGGPLGEYLQQWITEAPLFGRETSDWFIDRPLEPAAVEAVAAGCRRRMEILSRVDSTTLDPPAREHLAYFREMEQFCIDFYHSEGLYQQALRSLAKGEYAAAGRAIAGCQPEAVIERYARACSHGGITPGEQGVVLALNLNWRPYLEAVRQALAMSPIRYQFGPTSHEPAAQGPGTLTFYVDAKRNLWRSLGNRETGAAEFVVPEAVWQRIQPAESRPSRGSCPADRLEICRSGLASEKPLVLRLRPITWDMRPLKGPELAQPQRVLAGTYRVCLLMLDPDSTAAGQRVFEVVVREQGLSEDTPSAASDRVDLFQRAGGNHRAVQLVYPVQVGKSGVIEVKLTPIRGKALICGAVLEPCDAASDRRP